MTFSHKNLTLIEIANYYIDVDLALKEHFSEVRAGMESRYPGRLLSDIRDDTLAEHDRLCALSLRAAVEAAFRIDYEQRAKKRKKDPLSRQFREPYKIHGRRIALEDILGHWRSDTDIEGAGQIVGEIKAALNYRHWLAHGRYWVPRMGQRYDYFSVYVLVNGVFECFPFVYSEE